MIRLTMILAFVATAAGCSELQIIGNAAINELTAEGVNVEWKAYQERPEETGRKIVVAKAAANDGFSAVYTPKAANGPKGLWEGK